MTRRRPTASRRSCLVAGAWALALAVAALTPLGVARAESEGLTDERRRAIDRFVEPFVELAMFDGTLLVDLGGEVVYERSFGRAHYEFDIAHDERTRFRIASVSKTLTDAAFAALIQKRALALETPVSRFLPDFPSAGEMTIGHLLSHASGVPHSNRLPWGDGRTSLTLDEIVARLAALPLDFAPGTDSRYSNGGYAVAAKILELAVGKPFEEVMRETVFSPLGMSDTGHIADSRAAIPRLATGYEPGSYPGERRQSRFYAVETRPGGGSLYSTARDLLAFNRGVFREGFIDEKLRADVLGADAEGLLAQGRSPGCVAKLYYGAESDIIVVSLSNNYAVPADWARAIAELATGATKRPGWPELRPGRPTVGADDPRLGHYDNSRGGKLTIERTRRDVMTVTDPEGESFVALMPLADGAFLQPLYYQRCVQQPETRIITCRILSGDERYTTELTPVADPKPPAAE